MVDRLTKYYPDIKGHTAAVLGLAFKHGTNNMIESTSIPSVNWAQHKGATIHVNDSTAQHKAEKL